MRKTLALALALLIGVNSIPLSFAQAPFSTITPSQNQISEEVLELTAEQAVKIGIENNLSLKQIDNKIEVAKVSKDRARKNQKDLKEAADALEDGRKLLAEKTQQLEDGQETLDAAQTALDAGIAPQNIPLTDGAGNPVLDGSGDQVIIPAGANINDFLKERGMDAATAAATTTVIVSTVQATLDSTQDYIDENAVALAEGRELLSNSTAELSEVLEGAAEKIGVKITFDTPVELGPEDTGLLMITMADVNLDVTEYAKDIYRDQIAMLIQKNYYDALYMEKVAEVKKRARERGEKQYLMAKLAYENGMKSKDDYLLAKMYYDGTKLACYLADANSTNAKIELKKNMNIDLNKKIELKDLMLTNISEQNLEQGIKSALTNRLEIQQALGQQIIYDLNEELIKHSGKYGENSYAYREAKALKDGAELQLEKTKASVKAEVMASYETMTATASMLSESKELQAMAKEVVAIAKLKYEQGFGIENSLLKQMNLQDSSGTMLELIAAEEKLSEIEAQVAQITYSYTMATIKYQNDAGILKYTANSEE